MAKRNIVVIGGSAGSAAPLRLLMESLPAEFPGSVFITTHIPSTHPSYLPGLLGRIAKIRVSEAIDGQRIEPGHVYLAAHDRHLLLLDGEICLGAGPRENLSRPAIDPMFRSAALSFGSRAVGVILSGFLNDGASGLHAIKQAGGTCIVQHPLDAEEADMPRAALESVASDHVVPSPEIAGLLVRLADADAGPPAGAAPDSLAFEVEVAAGARSGSERLRRFADPAALTCPYCHGVLGEIRGEQPLRYRCRIGHAFTAEQLAAKFENLDQAVRVAMRVMEERVELVSRMARDARGSGRTAVAELYERRASEYRRYANTLREAALASRQVPSDFERID